MAQCVNCSPLSRSSSFGIVFALEILSPFSECYDVHAFMRVFFLIIQSELGKEQSSNQLFLPCTLYNIVLVNWCVLMLMDSGRPVWH